MDKPFPNIRDWDLALQKDIILAAEKKTGFSLLIGKFLKAAERRRWVVGVESAREYVELAEVLREAGGRWQEVGRHCAGWCVMCGSRRWRRRRRRLCLGLGKRGGRGELRVES